METLIQIEPRLRRQNSPQINEIGNSDGIGGAWSSG